MASGTLTIDLTALAENWRVLNQLAGGRAGAVVKANAYGLGTAQAVRTLAQAGARTFFVAQADEGGAVREALGSGSEICVFGGHMAGDADMIRDLNLIPMLNSVDQLTRHFEALPGHPFGIQLDTGMNRLGLKAAEWRAVRDIALEAGPRMVISHLACADEPEHAMNAAQLASFRDMTHGLDVPLSFSATGGTLLGADYHFDLTRPGVGLYGGMPFADARQVVHLSLPVIQIRDVAPGEAVGYGGAWTADTPARIATVAGGYADGLIRAMGGRAQLWHENTPCPLAGRVSMDLLTVDVTHLNGAEPKALDLLCPAQTVDDVAEAAGTIGYEILTSLGPRYGRRYVGGA